MTPAPIGGFFERHAPDGCAAPQSLLFAWTQGRPYAAFVNARSAFAALAGATPEATIWAPAFLCRDFLPPTAGRVCLYPVLEGFAPDLETVIAQAVAGDLVLVCAPFGEPVSGSARQALQARPDLRVVEDCSQALDPGPDAWADWRLFSPRKLLGVADGGLLIPREAAAAIPQPVATADAAALWRAPDLRASDPAGRRNAEWHAANQAKEAAMAASSEAMTGASLDILSRTSLDSLARPRMANWRALHDRLEPWSALAADRCAPPLGYVLRLPADRRDHVLAGLHAQRIFAAVHWPDIAGPERDFPREAAWTREVITLPCDHRYGVADMARVADAVEALLR